MRALIRALATLLAVALIPAGSLDAQTKPPRQEAVAECPTEDEVKEVIRTWRVESNRTALFPAQAVDRFEFSPIRFGRPTSTKTPQGDSVDSCPVRFTYSFVTTSGAGSQVKINAGAEQIHFFYRDPFDEWTFVTGVR